MGKRNGGIGHLHPPALMMNIMIISIILRDPLQRIPGQLEPGVIIHRLHHAEHEEPNALSDTQSCKFESQERADGVF